MFRVFVVLALCTSAYATELTADTIHTIHNRHALVNFYSPRSNHYIHMKAEWDKVVQHYEHDDRIVLAKVNVDEHPGLIEQFNIKKPYPDIRWFHEDAHDHEPDFYHHEHTYPTFVHFINQRIKSLPVGRFHAMDALIKDVHETCHTDDKKCFRSILFSNDHEFKKDPHTKKHTDYAKKLILRIRDKGKHGTKYLENELKRKLSTSKDKTLNAKKRAMAKAHFNILRKIHVHHEKREL